jgi:hypothetical protein
MGYVKAINGNLVFIAVVALVWSVFIGWNECDYIQSILHEPTSRLFHLFS